jgi:hypothetical protein
MGKGVGMDSKHVIGLMPGVPVPRIVSVCDGNGNTWFEVHIKNRGICGDCFHIMPDGRRWYFSENTAAYSIEVVINFGGGSPYRYQSRAAALDAIREYIEHTSAEKHFVLAEETIDCVPEAV